MTTRTFAFVPNEFYHIYNRGVEKRKIYLDTADHYRFIQLLYLANTTQPTDLRSIFKQESNPFDWERGNQLVAIGAYCLMPNHFHILASPLVENGMSLFMGKLGTSYSMYFNRKYERTGALFEGKFKAQHVDTDEYLKYLFSYIHLNPIKLIQPDWKEHGIQDVTKAFDFLSSFKYSSFLDYEGWSRRESVILNCEPFPEYFENTTQHHAELLDWLKYKEFTAT